MGPLDALNHLLNFLAPAAALSVLLWLGSRVFWRKMPVTQAWWAQIAINFILGSGVLLAGLWAFGRDGKMLTYAALVLVCASCQWCFLRAWRH
ncbi:hypothetical protein B2J86_03680 [Acidovorax sp. SRB_14]|uniref:hypothetical protein n=1 Tax=unclassified Acidovorax TaxID=2684926 RepID=UPI00145F48AD|nr:MULTISPECIES: hypothetical protein [unclassified Acidovorax]NMM75627.1 hypothetical protein [Acidovorax sp. SRB_24]NMM76855.1 hypothetical protein [Acidovorax sp. SRB_24]NMM80038.1 hypothetical protein [Acidovorax sp. SRB_14]NMM86223.1 hypothetical protein [Rhodococcus sp. SRB_17]